MKRMLKVFQVIGIVLVIAVITATSCGKTPAAGGGNNGNNNNSGGGADAPATIVITNVLAASLAGDDPGIFPSEANVIKVDGMNVSMKLYVFDRTGVGNTENFDDVLTEVDINTTDAILLRNKAFEFALSGASGGLVMIAPGNVASIGDFEAPAIAATVPADNAGNEGVFLVAGATASGFVAKGLNVYGVFMNTDATSVYAFSEAESDSTGDSAKPKFYCRAVIPEITTTSPAATATLKGGEKTECFLSWHGFNSVNATWLGNATRKEIEIAVGAVRTDEKKLSEIGISAAEFADGLTKADMAKIAAANKTDYKKFKITIVGYNAF